MSETFFSKASTFGDIGQKLKLGGKNVPQIRERRRWETKLLVCSDPRHFRQIRTILDSVIWSEWSVLPSTNGHDGTVLTSDQAQNLALPIDSRPPPIYALSS